MRAALLRGFSLVLAAGLLSACVTARTGAEYAVIMQKVGPPPPGQARIVVMSEKRDQAWAHLEVDGVKVPTRLAPGTYVYIDRPAGTHKIVATEPLFMGETRQEFTTAAGRTFFMVARPTERARMINAQTLMGGITGALVATALTAGYKNPGPVDLIPLEEASARIAIAELQLAE
jgi:hypothetical protein